MHRAGWMIRLALLGKWGETGVEEWRHIREEQGIRQRWNVVSHCWHLLWNLLTPNKPQALPKASVKPFFTLNAFDLHPKITASIQHNVHSCYHKCKTWQAGHKTAIQSREFLQIWKGCVFWQSGDIWAMRFSTCTRNIWKSDSSWQEGGPAVSLLRSYKSQIGGLAKPYQVYGDQIQLM